LVFTEQLNLLRETQFKLVGRNALNEFEVPAIHFASENGFASAIRFILKKNNRLRHTTMKGDRNKHRPLHRAAKGGHLEACKALLKYGGHVKTTNGKLTPLVLADQERSKLNLDSENVAKRKEFDKVIQLLRDENMMNNGIGGTDALEDARKDVRRVTKVEWCMCPLEGVVRLLGEHSVLIITVREDEDSNPVDEDFNPFDEDFNLVDEYSPPTYVIENVSDSKNIRVTLYSEEDREEFELKVKHIAHEDDILGDLTMDCLYSKAEEKGKYDVEKNNCHHTAQLLYNYALKDKSNEIKHVPYKFHAQVAKKIGICGSTVSESVEVRSVVPTRGDEPKMDIEANCPKYDHKVRDADTARLSFWVY
jgi:hypothetical protein